MIYRNCIEDYKKITKKKARELFSKGETIHFLPSMANPSSPWIQLVEFPKKREGEGEFEDILNRILIYQPKELGKTVNFYIPL